MKAEREEITTWDIIKFSIYFSLAGSIINLIIMHIVKLFGGEIGYNFVFTMGVMTFLFCYLTLLQR